VRAVPINESVGIIQPFWDPNISPFERYRFEKGEKAGAEIKQLWYCVQVSWSRAEAGQEIWRMSGELDVDLEDYDGLRIFCGLPTTTRLTVIGEVDGQERTIMSRVPGTDRIDWTGLSGDGEYSGPISGRKLERLTLICEAAESGPGGFTIEWVALVKQDVEKRLAAREPLYGPDWPGLLKPTDEIGELEPHLGLLFDRQELAHIREKIQHPTLKPLMEHLRRSAQELKNTEPERLMGRYAPDYPGTDIVDRMFICGFVGIVDQNMELLTMATRQMLAAAHTEFWHVSFRGNFPGSTFDHRSFNEGDLSWGTALVLDWAGALLTDHAKEVAACAICDKGLPSVRRDFLKWDYIFDCNQYAHFSRGRISGIWALSSIWPRAAGYMEIAERDLREGIDRTFNAQPDHGSKEGSNYYYATVYNSLVSLLLLARYQGKTLQEITPDCLKESTEYARATLSTVGQAGSKILYGDTGDPLNDCNTVSLMAMATGKKFWRDLEAALICDNAEPGVGAGPSEALYTLIYAEPPESRPQISLPTFILLPYSGILSSCRQTEAGDVHFVLLGASENAGHVHEDKGSFILEAFGESLAIDRGGVRSGPRQPLVTQATRHNVLSPAQVDEREPRQLNPCPDAVLPVGSGDEKTLEAAIDVTAAWGGLFKRCVRRVSSPEPDLFFICDEVEFEQPRAATFHLQTTRPISQRDEGYVVQGEKGALLVQPLWERETEGFREDYVARPSLDVYLPAQHLTLTSKPGASYRLVTVLQVSPTGEESWWEIVPDPDCANAWTARRGGVEHRFALD